MVVFSITDFKMLRNKELREFAFTGDSAFRKDLSNKRKALDFKVDDGVQLVGANRGKKKNEENEKPRSNGETSDSTDLIGRLPDDCLTEIFRFLPVPLDHSLCAMVSKKWLLLQAQMHAFRFTPTMHEPTVNAMVTTYDVLEPWLSYELGERPGYLTRRLEGKKATDTRLAAIAVGTQARGGLGRLCIRGGRPSDAGLRLIALSCPGLESLSLWECGSIGDAGLEAIAMGCTLLRKLDLRNCPLVTDKGLVAIAKTSSNLSSLTLEACPNVGDPALEATSKCSNNIKSLSLNNCPCIGDEGLRSMVSRLQKLKKLKLTRLKLSDKAFEAIAKYCSSLTSLTLTGILGIHESSFLAIGRGCLNLESVTINYCPPLDDSGLWGLTQTSSCIKTVRIEGCDTVTWGGAAALLSNLHHTIRFLSISRCNGIKDPPPRAPKLPFCPRLLSLAIRNCTALGDSFLSWIRDASPAIKRLDLTGLTMVTNLGIMALLDVRKEVWTEVSLSGCARVSDDSVVALCNGCGGGIRTLSLDGCVQVGDASLEAIARLCTCINDLDLSQCAVSDLGLEFLARMGCTSLRIFSLSGCSRISNGCMSFLKEVGAGLVGLNLMHCGGLSRMAIERLKGSLSKCDIAS
ncbi:EIN3-binding F-box protein 1 [Amborella trichopoda]|nr:EIN3-binding F-box protein 1 [Amborella trichopoda]|eukprot:XP_006849175.2 EIN3-binding F-box protein 1 [Amborella trichopoda]